MAVLFGAAVAAWLPEWIVVVAVAILFAGFGISALRYKEDGDDETVEEKPGHGIFATAFLLIFLADHGQSFGEQGKWLHTNNTPTEQNPAGFIWLSQSFREKYPEKVESLMSNRSKTINTSFLFHTILHGAAIHSPYLDVRQSLFSPDYQP